MGNGDNRNLVWKVSVACGRNGSVFCDFFVEKLLRLMCGGIIFFGKRLDFFQRKEVRLPPRLKAGVSAAN